MQHLALVRAAATVLSTALLSGAALAQAATMTDTAPLPATERDSNGAVILMDQPVLAQREAMQAASERTVDTRAMGAGPARVLQRVFTQEEINQQRALDAGKAKQSTPK